MPAHAAQRIVKLETEWGGFMPKVWSQLYEAMDQPALPGCLFFALEELVSGQGRWKGCHPDFLPFAEDEDGAVYGLYIPPVREKLPPVLRWRPDQDDYTPVASSFEAFCDWLLLLSAYSLADDDAEADWDDADEEEEDNEDEEPIEIDPAIVERTLEVLGLSLPEAPPTLDALLAKLMEMDPLGVWALLQAGARAADEGQWEESETLIRRAVEAAPYFADGWYLLSVILRQTGRNDESIEALWNTLECPVFFSTTIDDYPIEPEGEESQIHELARNDLLKANPILSEEDWSRPYLWNLLKREDWLHTSARLEFAEELDYEFPHVLLDALALAVTPQEEDEAYRRILAHGEMGHTARAARTREDSLRDDDD